MLYLLILFFVIDVTNIFLYARLFKDADEENDVVVMVAFFGSPLALYEKLSSGDETANALSCIQDLYRIGLYRDGNLGHIGTQFKDIILLKSITDLFYTCHVFYVMEESQKQ